MGALSQHAQKYAYVYCQGHITMHTHNGLKPSLVVVLWCTWFGSKIKYKDEGGRVEGTKLTKAIT